MTINAICLVAIAQIRCFPCSSFPDIPFLFSTRFSNVVWSIESKAAERANTRTENHFRSDDWKFSLETLGIAVSVEWNSLYADWFFSWRLYKVKRCSLRLSNTFSSTMEITGDWTQPSYFKRVLIKSFLIGLIRKDLNAYGTQTEPNHELIILVVTGKSIKTCLLEPSWY